MHPSTFEYLKPTDEQIDRMARVQCEASRVLRGARAGITAGTGHDFRYPRASF